MTGTCISERTRRGQEEDDERIDERLKGKYEVWKFGLGPSQWRDAGGWVGGSSMSLLESSRDDRTCMRMWTLRVKPFHIATDIKLLRQQPRLGLTREDCLDCVLS